MILYLYLPISVKWQKNRGKSGKKTVRSGAEKYKRKRTDNMKKHISTSWQGQFFAL